MLESNTTKANKTEAPEKTGDETVKEDTKESQKENTENETVSGTKKEKKGAQQDNEKETDEPVILELDSAPSEKKEQKETERNEKIKLSKASRKINRIILKTQRKKVTIQMMSFDSLNKNRIVEFNNRMEYLEHQSFDRKIAGP